MNEDGSNKTCDLDDIDLCYAKELQVYKKSLGAISQKGIPVEEATIDKLEREYLFCQADALVVDLYSMYAFF